MIYRFIGRQLFAFFGCLIYTLGREIVGIVHYPYVLEHLDAVSYSADRLIKQSQSILSFTVYFKLYLVMILLVDDLADRPEILRLGLCTLGNDKMIFGTYEPCPVASAAFPSLVHVAFLFGFQ